MGKIKEQITTANMNCTNLKNTVIPIFLFGKYFQSFIFISWGNNTIRYLYTYQQKLDINFYFKKIREHLLNNLDILHCHK